MLLGSLLYYFFDGVCFGCWLWRVVVGRSSLGIHHTCYAAASLSLSLSSAPVLTLGFRKGVELWLRMVWKRVWIWRRTLFLCERERPPTSMSLLAGKERGCGGFVCIHGVLLLLLLLVVRLTVWWMMCRIPRLSKPKSSTPRSPRFLAALAPVVV